MHVNFFIRVKLAIEIGAVEVESVNIPVIAGSDGKNDLETGEACDWGEGIEVVDAELLCEASSNDKFVPGLPENLKTSLMLQHMLNFRTWKESYSYDENDIFKQLFNGIVNAVQFVWEETCPEKQWLFITGAMSNTPERTSTIRPDVFFYHSDKQHSNSQPYSYYHIAFTAELKKSANFLNMSALCVLLVLLNHFQNASNVVEAMEYIMAIDTQQHFIFSITLKNASLRLWYANRSMLVCSKPLDILKVASTPFLMSHLTSEHRTRNTVSGSFYHLCSHPMWTWAWILQSSLWRALKVAFTTSM